MKRIVRFGLGTLVVLVALAAINFAPMLTPLVPGMQRFTYDGTVVHARQSDAEDAQRIAERVNASSERVRDAFAATDDAPIEVIVYPSRAALGRKTLGLAGMLLPSWYIGTNTSDRVMIVSPSNPGPSHTRESVEQAAVHEYVHVLTYRRNRELDYWLMEGIALYLAEQTPEVGSVAGAADLTWGEYRNTNAVQFANVGGYSLAWTLIDYIQERHGWQTVIALTQPGATYQSVLGVSEREFFDRWLAAVRGRYAAG